MMAQRVRREGAERSPVGTWGGVWSERCAGQCPRASLKIRASCPPPLSVGVGRHRGSAWVRQFSPPAGRYAANELT